MINDHIQSHHGFSPSRMNRGEQFFGSDGMGWFFSAREHFTDPIPLNTKQYRELYWPSTTMYQPVLHHTDPVPPSTFHYRPSNRQLSPLDLFLAHLMSHTQYTWSSYITFSYFSLSSRLLAAPLKFNCKIFWGVFQRAIAWRTCSKALKKAVNFLDTAAIKPVHCPRVSRVWTLGTPKHKLINIT